MKEDWIECNLGELSVFELGGDWGKTPEFKDENYIKSYCIRGSEFRNWKIEKGKTASLRKLKKASVEKRNLQVNDILVEISGGGPEQPVGRTEIIDNSVLKHFNGSNLVCTNFLRLIRPTKHINAYYLNYYLKYFYSTGKIIRYQAGSNNLRNLKFKDYLTINIPLSPLIEQNTIVKKIEALFSSLESGIADLKKAQDQLVIYRQAVLKKAFEGLSEIPLERLVISSQNGMSKRSGKEGNEIKVLRLADITNLKIDNNSPRTILLTKKEFVKYGLKEGDLLIIRVNGSIDLVGRMIEVGKKDELEKWAFCDHLIRLKLNNEKCVASFYFYFFQLPKIRKYIHQNMVSSAGQNTVSQGTVKSISVPLCSIDKQHQIVHEIESRLSVCDTVEKDIADSLEKAQALRQSILKKAFEGKLLSQEEIAACKAQPAYEPASVLLEKIKKKQR